VISYNIKLENVLDMQTNKNSPVWDLRILYCPFFPLHGSLRIISCTDLVQYYFYGVA